MLVVGGVRAGATRWPTSASFDEDLLLADLEIVSGRIERLRESVEEAAPQPRAGAGRAGRARAGARGAGSRARRCTTPAMTDEQLKATRSFRLLTEKPRLVLVNLADDEADPERFVKELPRARAAGRWPCRPGWSWNWRG